MKKSTFMLGVMSFALLGFVSCNKNNEKAMAFEATTTQFEVVESEDRAYMDANCNVYFEQGDVVRMFNISATPSESECADYAAKSTGTHVYFEAIDDMTLEAKGSFYAFFPGGNVTADLSNENRATFTLSPVQVYQEVNGTPSFSKEDMYMASKVDNVSNFDNVDFKFENICGILRLKYYTTGDNTTIRSITVKDRHFSLSGDVNLKIDAVTTEGLVDLCNSYDPANPEASAQAINDYKQSIGYNVTNAGDQITLDFGANGYTLSDDANNPSVFYFVLRPLALSHGYYVIVTDMDGNEYTVVNSTSNRKIMPNTIRSIAAKDLEQWLH